MQLNRRALFREEVSHLSYKFSIINIAIDKHSNVLQYSSGLVHIAIGAKKQPFISTVLVKDNKWMHQFTEVIFISI